MLKWFRDTILGGLSWIARVVVFFIFIGIIFSLIGLLMPGPIPSNAVIALDLRGPVADKKPEDPFAAFSGGGGVTSVIDVVTTLAGAEKDANVKGVYIELGGSVPVGHAKEIRDALQRFRASGKFVITHAEAFFTASLGDYYIASAADEVWLQPGSEFNTAGLAASTVFLRGLFDKIQADPQFTQRYEYKNAANTYTQTDYTPAHREAMEALLQSRWNVVTADMAAGRKMDTAKLQGLLDTTPLLSDEALAQGLVDKIGFAAEAEEAAKKRADDGETVDFAAYQQHGEKAYASGDVVAVIHGAGVIQSGSGGADPLGGGEVFASRPIAEAFREAAKDDAVKVIVFRVDSPGGSALASDEVLNALREAQAKGKKVVVSMANLAASGGYWVSAYADAIVAQPTTITGSIGVLSGKLVINRTYELVGLNPREFIVGGRNTLLQSPFKPFSPEEWAAFDKSVDMIYERFTGLVSEGRKMDLARVQEIAKGRVWSGADAKERGLVDQLGGFHEALAKAKEIAGIPADAGVTLRFYPAAKTPAEQLAEMFGASAETAQALMVLGAVLDNEHVAAALRAFARADAEGTQAISEDAEAAGR